MCNIMYNSLPKPIRAYNRLSIETGGVGIVISSDVFPLNLVSRFVLYISLDSGAEEQLFSFRRIWF